MDALLGELAERQGRAAPPVHREALELMSAWRWPGNVRELRNLLERCLLFADGDGVSASDLPAYLRSDSGPRVSGASWPIPAGLDLKGAEREYIRYTLESTGGRVQEAAELLGISRKNLWEKRKRYGLLD